MALPPTKPVSPSLALRSVTENFVANTEAWIAYQATGLPTYINDSNNYIQTSLEAVYAVAYLNDLPPLTGKGGWALFAKDAEDGLEFVDITPTIEERILRSGDENLAGGFASTIDVDGVQSGVTYTPSLTGGNYKRITNGGVFTLAAPTIPAGRGSTMVIEVTNNATAGAVTITGFDVVEGNLLTTINGDKFLLQITATDTSKALIVLALQ